MLITMIWILLGIKFWWAVVEKNPACAGFSILFPICKPNSVLILANQRQLFIWDDCCQSTLATHCLRRAQKARKSKIEIRKNSGLKFQTWIPASAGMTPLGCCLKIWYCDLFRISNFGFRIFSAPRDSPVLHSGKDLAVSLQPLISLWLNSPQLPKLLGRLNLSVSASLLAPRGLLRTGITRYLAPSKLGSVRTFLPMKWITE